MVNKYFIASLRLLVDQQMLETPREGECLDSEVADCHHACDSALLLCGSCVTLESVDRVHRNDKESSLVCFFFYKTSRNFI